MDDGWSRCQTGHPDDSLQESQKIARFNRSTRAQRTGEAGTGDAAVRAIFSHRQSTLDRGDPSERKASIRSEKKRSCAWVGDEVAILVRS